MGKEERREEKQTFGDRSNRIKREEKNTDKEKERQTDR